MEDSTHQERVILQHGFDQYQGVQLGYGLDYVHHLFLADFDQLTVILFGGQRLGTGLGHPVVLLDGRQRDPRVGILVEEPVQQVHQLRRRFRLDRPRHGLCSDLLVHGQHGIRGVRQPAVNKRVQRAPQRPYVQRFSTVRRGRRVQHFGRRESRRARARAQQVVAAVEFVAHSQVGDFHVPVGIDQQIRWLYIPVYDPLEVYCEVKFVFSFHDKLRLRRFFFFIEGKKIIVTGKSKSGFELGFKIINQLIYSYIRD